MIEQTLMDLVERVRGRFYGKYRGKVYQVDAKHVPRIRALVPAVLGNQPTGWCMPCVPYAGQKVGIAFMPEKGAGVWIEFEGGDVSFPIWTGCFWHDDELPDRLAPAVKVIKTPGNAQIVLDDKNHTITVTDTHENQVHMDSKGVTIVRSKGKIAVLEDKVSANNGAMEITP
jgi:uncharacterized protein involved in type VI secretion and phage assembly